MTAPDRTYATSSPPPAANAPTYHEALDPSTSSFLSTFDDYFGAFVSYGDVGVTVGFATPAPLDDDYKWMRARINVAARGQYGSGAVSVVSNTNPAVRLGPAGNGAGANAWRDLTSGHTAMVVGPRQAYSGPYSYTLTFGSSYIPPEYATPPESAGWYRTDVNNLRLTEEGVLLPPTTTIVGPVGTVTPVVDPVLGQVYEAAWTYTSPDGLPQLKWYLDVALNADGTGLIFHASGGQGTSYKIPAYYLAPYLGQTLWVRVSVEQDTRPTGYQAWYPGAYGQPGPWASAQFTPTGTITSTFRAVRPAGWVDDLPAAERLRLTASHYPVTRAVLYQWDGSRSWELDIIDGAVTFDADQQIRGLLELTVANAELRPLHVFPLDSERPLHPYGSYIQIGRGVGDAMVALGAFVVEEVLADVTVSGASAVTVRGADFSRFLADAQFTYNITRHTLAGGAFTADLATDVLAAIVREAGLTPIVNGSSTQRVTVGYLNKRTDSRPDALDGIVKALSWIWYANGFGEIVFEPIPTIALPARYALAEGPDCTVIRHAVTYSRADVYDISVAFDEAGLYVGGSFDEALGSPIRRGNGDPDVPTDGAGQLGPGGKPRFLSSPNVISVATAQATAQAELIRAAFPAETIELELVPIPDLRVGHVITLQRFGEAPRSWLVRVVTTPLEPTERQTVTAINPPTWLDPAVALSQLERVPDAVDDAAGLAVSASR